MLDDLRVVDEGKVVTSAGVSAGIDMACTSSPGCTGRGGRRDRARDGVSLGAAGVSELARLISELVRIESVNPSLDPTGSGEGEIAAFVADWMRGAGFEVELQEAAPGRPNVIGIRPRHGRRSLADAQRAHGYGRPRRDAPIRPGAESRATASTAAAHTT